MALWRVLVCEQVGVASQKEKARLKPCFNITSRFRFLVPNQCAALDGIRNSLRYGIDTQCRMESVADGMESRTKGKGDTRQAVMPYADKPQFHTIRYAN